MIRESWEFASTLIAETHGIPLARVGLGLAAVEAESIGLAAPAVDAARAGLGLPPDPDGSRLRESPYLTMVPPPLELPGHRLPERTRRFSPGDVAPSPPLPDWWPGNDDPLVYLSFGSVTAAAHLPYFPTLYRAAIEALAPLPIRILVTTGDGGDPDRLGPVPANVRLERWVHQDSVLPQAAAFVCHGGYGSTLGALAHGTPFVVLPLFSPDQWANAEAVARAGAGVGLDGDRGTREVLGLPDPAILGELAAAVRRVLGDGSYRHEARRIADAVRTLPPVDEAVDVLEALGAARV